MQENVRNQLSTARLEKRHSKNEITIPLYFEKPLKRTGIMSYTIMSYVYRVDNRF